MKLLGLLTLLLIVASSVGSLRGNRELKSHKYEEYEGVCRKNSNGTGGGEDGDEYDKYTRKDNKDVDFNWCKNKCNNKSKCTGFEYRDTGDTSQCEVWKKTIGGYKKKNEHVCFVVKDDSCDPYLSWGDGVCRKYKDGDGKGNDGDEYDLYKNKDYDWCEEKCLNDSKCTGIEWIFGPGDKEQCEIWHVEIKSVLDKPDAYCDIKKCH